MSQAKPIKGKYIAGTYLKVDQWSDRESVTVTATSETQKVVVVLGVAELIDLIAQLRDAHWGPNGNV